MMSDDIISPKLNVKIIEAYGLTQAQYNNYSYKWTVNNFSYSFEKNRNRITSEIFPNQPMSGLQWRLVLYLKGFDSECENFVSTFVEVVSTNICLKNLTGRVKIKILNFPYAETPMIEFDYDWKIKSYLVGFKHYIDQEAFYKALINDQLIAHCEVDTARNYIYTWPDSITIESRFACDFEFLLENQNFSDVTLCVNEKTLKAHKGILAARCPVFNAMFNDTPEELQNNTVNITDVKYEVLVELLRYIYTEKVRNLEKIGIDLLMAAHKYQLDELKQICEKASATIHLTLQNAAEILIIAHQYRATPLKLVLLNYIRKNSQNVINSLGWKILMQEFPELADEAFCAVAQNSNPVEPLGKRRKRNNW